jgi:glycosyltransferase involved in cell wall biosynthesis
MTAISIVIPVYNAASTLKQCLDAVFSSTYSDYECIVVDDGSKDGSQEMARQYPARVLELEGGPCGPAFARNAGAEIAAGEILFFVDADVLIRPETLERIAGSFANHPDVDALFGSYDENPAGGEFISQYKNLYHHFVHQQGQENASTFWSGCGAIRANVFRAAGGFNAQRYARPSIEDIELGYRLKSKGHRILLSKDIQVKHLKHWSFSSLVKTDIIHRALPWTMLILQNRSMPNDLNLRLSQRLSSVLLVALLLHLGLFSLQQNVLLLSVLTGMFLLLMSCFQWRDETFTFTMTTGVERLTFLSITAFASMALVSGKPALLPPVLFLLLILLAGRLVPNPTGLTNHILFGLTMIPATAAFVMLLASYPLALVIPFLVCLAIIVLLNRDLYMFFFRKRGLAFAIAALPLQLFYYLYSMAALAVGGGIYLANNSLRGK